MFHTLIGRLTSFVAVAALLGLFSGCELPVSNSAKVADSPPLPPGWGEVSFSLSSVGRALVSDRASQISDTYEMIALSSDATQSAVLNPASSTPIRLPIGTYRIHILAGIKRSSGSNSVYFLGSGTANSVSIEDGKRTSCAISMKTAEFSFWSEGSLEWGTEATFKAAGASANPYFGMSIDGSSTTRHPRLKSVELWNGYKDPTGISGTPDSWSMELKTTVPDSFASTKLQFVGASVVYSPNEGTWATLDGITKYDWKWMNRADMVEPFPLTGVSELIVEGKVPSTGLSVSLVWN